MRFIGKLNALGLPTWTLAAKAVAAAVAVVDCVSVTLVKSER